jgi:hypothetical protein
MRGAVYLENPGVSTIPCRVCLIGQQEEEGDSVQETQKAFLQHNTQLRPACYEPCAGYLFDS